MDVREPQPQQHWFEPLAEHMGPAYLRYSFTKGTEQEADFLVDALGLRAGDRVLDVGCGPGRHAHALAGRGMNVVGVDISQRFVDLAVESAPAGATFVRADARKLSYDAEFDAAVSLCQGAFGLVGAGDDIGVLAAMTRSVRPGGRVALTAFSAYFQVRFLEDSAEFDADTGTHHEWTSVKDEAGVDAPAEAWTTCYTPRELRLLADDAGLVVDAVWSVDPGNYGRRPPNIDSAEWFLLAHRQP